MSRIDVRPSLRILLPLALFLAMTAVHILRLPAQGAGLDQGARLVAAGVPVVLGAGIVVWLLSLKQFSVQQNRLQVSNLFLPFIQRSISFENIAAVRVGKMPLLSRGCIVISCKDSADVKVPMRYQNSGLLLDAMLEVVAISGSKRSEVEAPRNLES